MTPRRPGYERIAGVDMTILPKSAPAITNPNNGISFSLPAPTMPINHDAFQAAAEAYEAAAQQIHNLLLRESELKKAVTLRKVDLEVIEARFIAEGKVCGANAEQRKASLLLLCREDEEYHVTTSDQTVDELDLGRIEAGLELARDGRSIAKRRMDAAIVLWSLEAASLT